MSSGTPVMRLLDTSRMFLNVGVDEVDVRYVEVGQEVIVTLEAYPELRLSGRVVEVGIVPGCRRTGSYFPGKLSWMIPIPGSRWGMSAEAEIAVEKAENVPHCALWAVTVRDGRNVVAKVTEAGVETVEVVTGLTDGFLIENQRGPLTKETAFWPATTSFTVHCRGGSVNRSRVSGGLHQRRRGECRGEY